ncbi:hypothetical protein [Desulfovibrio sp. JC010]|uniref:hypothetical protein n=1 Tax=Desulfovibrio sp. JC010 TaxID=2593641 RepID=UPI0013D3D99F|nr:hypothetical protein [Desulfovibrio sp. JC010]NDV25955.1 hypothetical protein [Desulfovibrio sp. JC010]
MRGITFSDNETIFHNWFKVDSFILFPDDEVKRIKAFSFLYYRFIMEHREYDGFDVGDIDYEEVAEITTEIIADFDFLKELKKQRRSRAAAGLVIRILYSQVYHNFEEPSINKAKSLYRTGLSYLKKEAKNKDEKFHRNISESYINDVINNYRNRLHYCAAYNITRPPNSLTEKEFIKDVKNFFSIAERYKSFCINYKASRRGAYTPPVVPEERILHIDPGFEICPATDDKLEPYPKEKIERYFAKNDMSTKTNNDKT